MGEKIEQEEPKTERDTAQMEEPKTERDAAQMEEPRGERDTVQTAEPAAESNVVRKAERKQDFTQGNVMKQIVLFTLPLVASSLLQALYNMVDMMIAGRFVGAAAISAINNSSQILVIVTKIAIGITTGGSVLIGQFYGGKDERSREEATGTLVSLSAILGVVFAIALWAGAGGLLRLLQAPAFDEAVRYLRICSAGIFFVYLYNAFSSMLRAVGDSKTPMRIVIATTVVNTVLDIVFVGGLVMGVAGAALATVIAQVISAVLSLLAVMKEKDLIRFTWEFLKIRMDMFVQTMRVGIPSAVQMTIAGFSWLVVTFLINRYGTDISAGNGVAIKIKDMCQLLLSAMSTGAVSVIAQNLGAELYDRAKAVMYATMKMALLVSLVTIGAVVLSAPWLAGIFTKDPAVIDSAVLNMRIEIWGQVFYAVFLIYHSLMIGAGHSTFAMMSSFTNCIVFRVVLALVFEKLWGLEGIYIACAIAPFSSVPIGYIYTRSGIWKRSLVKNKGNAVK